MLGNNTAQRVRKWEGLVVSDTNPTPAPKPEETAGAPRPAGPDHDGPVSLGDTRVPPELREWARQQFSEEEFLRELQKVKELGGLAFEDFFDDLVREVGDGRDA